MSCTINYERLQSSHSLVGSILVSYLYCTSHAEADELGEDVKWSASVNEA